MKGWYSVDRRMNFIKFVARKRKTTNGLENNTLLMIPTYLISMVSSRSADDNFDLVSMLT